MNDFNVPESNQSKPFDRMKIRDGICDFNKLDTEFIRTCANIRPDFTNPKDKVSEDLNMKVPKTFSRNYILLGATIGLSKEKRERAKSDPLLQKLMDRAIEPVDPSNPESVKLGKENLRNLIEYVKKSNFDPEAFVNGIRFSKHLDKFREVSRKLMEIPGLGDQLFEEMKILDVRLARGDMNQAEYDKQSWNLLDKYVKESGNKDLQKTWERDDEKFIADAYQDYKVEQRNKANEIPVKDDDTTVKAVDEINKSLGGAGMSFKVTFTADPGEAVIYTDNSNFVFDASIYKDSNSGEFVYYLSDKYGHGDSKGPFTGKTLADAVDGRQIDAFISDKIEDKSRKNDADLRKEVKDLPDDFLTKLGQKLVGEGKDRSYSIEGKSRVVLSNLSYCLIASNQEGDKSGQMTMYDKVKELNKFLAIEDNRKKVVETLYNGGLEFSTPEVAPDGKSEKEPAKKPPTISELIGK